MTAAAILALIQAAATLATQLPALYNQVKSTFSSDDQAAIEAALATLQRQEAADYTQAESDLKTAGAA